MRRRNVLAMLAGGVGALGGCLSGGPFGEEAGDTPRPRRGDTSVPVPERTTGREVEAPEPETAGPTATRQSPLDRTYDENAAAAVTESPLTRAVAVERAADGNWWVLEVSMRDDGLAAVYEYTTGWEPAGTATVFRLTRGDRGVVPTDVSARPDGGWDILGAEEAVVAFDGDWTATGQRRELARGPDWESTARPFGIERTSDGWWASAYDRIVRYDRSFEEIRASYHVVDDLALGSEYYNETYGTLPVSTIRSVHLSAAGRLVLRANVGRKFYVFDNPGRTGLGSTTPERVLSPETNPPSGYGLASGPDGERYVLRGNGTLYRYTADWQFAGERFTVGSGEAFDRYPPDSRG